MERIIISDNQIAVLVKYTYVEVQVQDIAEIYLTQGLMGKRFNYGTITLYTFSPLSNGENRVVIKNIDNPQKYYKEIYDCIIKNSGISDLKRKHFSPNSSVKDNFEKSSGIITLLAIIIFVSLLFIKNGSYIRSLADFFITPILFFIIAEFLYLFAKDYQYKNEKYLINKIGVLIERNFIKEEKFFIKNSSISNIKLESNDNFGTIWFSTIGSTLRKIEKKEKFRIFKQNRITVFDVSNSPFKAFRWVKDGYKIYEILKSISEKNISKEQAENKNGVKEEDIVIKPKYIFFNAFYDRLKAFFVSLPVAPITTVIIDSPLNPVRGGCGWELILIIVFSSLLGVSGLIFLVTLFLCIVLYKTYKNAKYIISENKITTEFFYEKQIEFNKINKISLEQSLIQKKNKLATIYIFKDKKEKLKLIDIENPYKIYQNIKDKINSHKNANKTIGYTISQEINFKSICISIFVALLYALIISLIIILILVIWVFFLYSTTKDRVYSPASPPIFWFY